MTRGWEVGVWRLLLGCRTGLGQRVWVSVNRKTDKRIKSRTGRGGGWGWGETKRARDDGIRALREEDERMKGG